MTYLLTNLLQDVYAELGQLHLAAAIGGSATSLVDASLDGAHSDDEWKGGAIFISRADGAPPEGEFAAVAGYEASTGTFALSAALSAPIAAGDHYGLASAYYPLATMIELTNAGLRALGDIPLVDDQTLITGSGENSFAATIEWTRRRPLRIDYQAIPGLTAMDPWRTLHDWDFVPAAPGAPGLILFADALPAGRRLRVWFQAAHPTLRIFSDPIAESIPPELAVAAGIERALRWQNARLGGSDAHLAARWEQAQLELANARRAFPIWRSRRAAKMLAVTR